MPKVSDNIITGNVSESKHCREFIDGSTRSHAQLKSCTMGFGKYKSGWKWSEHAGAQNGKPSENHIGYILSGQMIVKDYEGNEAEVVAGEAFEIGPGSDAWVIGDEVCIALDFLPTPTK